jgi:hypothetical protein
MFLITDLYLETLWLKSNLYAGRHGAWSRHRCRRNGRRGKHIYCGLCESFIPARAVGFWFELTAFSCAPRLNMYCCACASPLYHIFGSEFLALVYSRTFSALLITCPFHRLISPKLMICLTRDNSLSHMRSISLSNLTISTCIFDSTSTGI